MTTTSRNFTLPRQAERLLVIALCTLVVLHCEPSIAGDVALDRTALALRVDASSSTLNPTLWRSGAGVLVPGDRDLYWTSNDEVIFVRVEAGAADAPHRTYSISVWNVRTNEIRTVLDLGRAAGSICFSAGHLLVGSYSKEEGRRSYFGSTRSLSPLPAGTKIDVASCRPRGQVPALPEWTKGRVIHRLERAEWGFLDFGDQQQILDNSPIKFYRVGAKPEEGIALPLRRRETGHLFRYFEFADAHYVESTYWQMPRPKGVPYPVYWIHRDGQVETIAEIPFGPWRYAGSWTEPTRKGVVLASTNFNTRNERDVSHAGLYLVAGEKVTKLLSTWVNMTAVSPNGCRIAFDHAEQTTRRGNRLVAFDICGVEG